MRDIGSTGILVEWSIIDATSALRRKKQKHVLMLSLASDRSRFLPPVWYAPAVVKMIHHGKQTFHTAVRPSFPHFHFLQTYSPDTYLQVQIIPAIFPFQTWKDTKNGGAAVSLVFTCNVVKEAKVQLRNGRMRRKEKKKNLRTIMRMTRYNRRFAERIENFYCTVVHCPFIVWFTYCIQAWSTSVHFQSQFF